MAEYIKKEVIPLLIGLMGVAAIGVTFGIAAGFGFLHVTTGKYLILYDAKEPK